MSKGDIRFYVDTLIVETVLGDPSLVKTASMSDILSGLAPTIKDYVGQHINPEDKAGSVINMLSPALIFELLKTFGFGKFGMLLAVITSVFHIDVASMIEPLFQTVKETLSQGGKVSGEQIDAAVTQTVQQHAPQDDQSPADAPLGNVAQVLQDARMLRLAIEQYEIHTFRLTKRPEPFIFAYAAGRGARYTNVFGSILGWIFKVILFSAGFLLVGDVANKMMGRPNAIDKNWHAGEAPSGGPAAVPTPVTTQTKFPVNPSYQITAAPQPWTESVTNNASSIENMLVNFTKDVYAGLDGKEAAIQSSPTFQGVRDQIVWYNKAASGEPKVYIPSMYPNKKAIVDHYIDEVSRSVDI